MEKLLGFAAAGALGWAYVMFMAFFGLVALAGVAFWIWILVDILQHETDEGNQRLIWVLVIIFTHWLGALIYLIVRRTERIAKQGR
jgi:hypothetical protein